MHLLYCPLDSEDVVLDELEGVEQRQPGFTEGVDFADAACRGVVITGLPLPPFVDAKVELKRNFLDQRKEEARRSRGKAWHTTKVWSGASRRRSRR